MIAAIYARRSTDQQVADEAKSVIRQVENARSFVAEHGWNVDERFIFVDDGISGAETHKLVAKQRLLAMLGKRCPFGVLVMQSQDRLSRRDGDESLAELKVIARAGVEVWFYADRQQFTYGTFASNTLGFLKGEFAAEFRRAIAQKTSEAMLDKARRGQVTGGRVFGYENVRIAKGHVERRILEDEAAIVRRIFTLYSQGRGYRAIAHLLNEQHVPKPRAQRGRPDGWDQGTIKAVLDRALYRGVVEYNRTKKRDLSGQINISSRPESDRVAVERPELRIVSEELQALVDVRLADRRERYLRNPSGQLLGQPTGKYLLSGLLRCPCGANFEAQKSPHGMTKGLVYVCSAHRRKGSAICANRLALAIAETDKRILNVIEGEVLSAAFVETVLDTVFVSPGEDRSALEAEAQDLEHQIGNLTNAIKIGGTLLPLVEALKSTQARLVVIRRQLEPRESANREELRAALEQRVEEWREILRANPAQGRQVLQHVIGPIMLWLGEASDLDVADGADPKDRRGKEGITAADVRWSAETRPAGLLAGMPLVQRMASPTGFEPVFWP